MKRAYLNIVFAYLIAGATAILVGRQVDHWHPILVVGAADLAGTIVIFIFSVYHNNSSIYDAYWSVAPILIAFYWLVSGLSTTGSLLRLGLVMALVLVWSVRLTLNWAVRWRGLLHEDWRYVNFRNQTGPMYWTVSFFGIHLMPTIIVFLGCLSLIPSMAEPKTGFNILDLVALIITAAAIWFETRSDLDITRFQKSSQGEKELIQTGLWSLSRHPNYFGEILFWWGVFLFGLAANPDYWWTITGPAAITLLFIFISIPMIEKHMLARRPEYAEYIKSTSILIPWRRRKQE